MKPQFAQSASNSLGEPPFDTDNSSSRGKNRGGGEQKPGVVINTRDATTDLSGKFGTKAAAMKAVAPYVQNTISFDSDMIATVLTHRGLTYSSFDSRFELPEGFFFVGGAEVDKFIAEEGWVTIGSGCFAKFVDNLPIAKLYISPNSQSNYCFDVSGDSSEVEKIAQLAIRQVRRLNDNEQAKKSYYTELIDFDPYDRPQFITQEITRETIIKPEYYPYLDGGIERMLRDFIEGEENCTVWFGEPGGGKTSGFRGMVEQLSLSPIIAMKPALFTNKNFLSTIFAQSDSIASNNLTQQKIKGIFDHPEATRPEASMRKSSFADYLKEKWGVIPRQERNQEIRVPIILIEDADILMGRRDKGNSWMNQLLNEVDGLGSSQSRKIIFTTNKTTVEEIDPALLRPGRCFGSFHFRRLTAAEAIAARAAAGLPPFEEEPTRDMSLATALQRPKHRFVIGKNGAEFGFKK